MAVTKKKPAAKPAVKKATAKVVAKPSAKAPAKAAPKATAKPVVKAKAPAKVAAKPAPKPAAKPVAKAPAKPVAKGAAKSAAKPAAKGAVLNKGALMAKEAAERRRAEAAAAAAKAAEEAARKRVPRLVPATPEVLRAGIAKQVPGKGGKMVAKPVADARPLGMLPPESMAKTPRNTPSTLRVVIPQRPVNAEPGADASRPATKGDQRLNDDDLKYFEKRLLAERARMMREMGHLESTVLSTNRRDDSGEVGGSYSFHMADAGTDSMEREIAFDVASKEGRLLREIDDALRRIYNGTYGICEASGQPIPRGRLEALPWARFTVQEQENLEKQQRAGRIAREEE
jgi:RNA polymerase-binding transcription factor DksA